MTAMDLLKIREAIPTSKMTCPLDGTPYITINEKRFVVSLLGDYRYDLWAIKRKPIRESKPISKSKPIRKSKLDISNVIVWAEDVSLEIAIAFLKGCTKSEILRRISGEND